MTGQRLKGQEINVRIIQAAVLVASLDSIMNFNEEVALELKEQGYLGEFSNRFDEIFNGFGGDFEMHVANANWNTWQQAVIARAQRVDPSIIFNVIRTDFFPDGSSNIYTYTNVSWGAMPAQLGGRGDYLKVKGQFKCSERPVASNALP